jgi:purine-binding chemotaxis protein CheW
MEELAVQKKQITDTTKQYIVIKLDNELFGIDIMYIDNIVRMQRITRVPKCQDFYKGVINLRGEIVPVMSLRSRFGLEEDKETSQSRIIIIKPELQAMVGVQVDMVKEVVTLDEDAIEKNNVGLSDNGQLFISAVGKYNGELISILNLQAIVAEKEQL